MEEVRDGRTDDTAMDSDALTSRLHDSRQELLALLIELNRLELRICPRIEAEYQHRVGHHEYDLFKAQAELSRLKRKLELVKASLGQGIHPRICDIEKALDLEFEDAERQLSEHHAYISRMERRLEELQDTVDEDELDDILSILLERLHPDMHADSTERQKHLFPQVQDAYMHGDLDRLYDLEVITRSIAVQHEVTRFSTEKLADHLAMCEVQIGFTRTNIESIKNNYPYTEHLFLADEEHIEQNIRDVEELIAQYHEEYSWYTMELHALLDR